MKSNKSSYGLFESDKKGNFEELKLAFDVLNNINEKKSDTVSQRAIDNILYLVYYHGIKAEQLDKHSDSLNNFEVNKCFCLILEGMWTFDKIKNVKMSPEERKSLDKERYIPYGNYSLYQLRLQQLQSVVYEIQDKEKDLKSGSQANKT